MQRRAIWCFFVDFSIHPNLWRSPKKISSPHLPYLSFIRIWDAQWKFTEWMQQVSLVSMLLSNWVSLASWPLFLFGFRFILLVKLRIYQSLESCFANNVNIRLNCSKDKGWSERYMPDDKMNSKSKKIIERGVQTLLRISLDVSTVTKPWAYRQLDFQIKLWINQF